MNEEIKSIVSADEAEAPKEVTVTLDSEIESDAEDTASRLHEMIKQASEEAKLEKSAAPSPKTARLSYSAYSDMRPSKDSVYAPVGIFSYFGLLILTAVPVIGFIAAIVFAFAAKKLAFKRLATAVIAVQTLFLLVTAIAIIVAVFVLGVDPLDCVGSTLDFLKDYFTKAR